MEGQKTTCNGTPQFEKIKNKIVVKKLKRYRIVYIMMIPAFLYFLFMKYLPMYGYIMAFQDYDPYLNFSGSPFVGWKYFQQFFSNKVFWQAFNNTWIINALKFGLSIPCSIILALLLNEVKSKFFKKTVQTFSLLPYFLSWTIVGAFALNLFSKEYGYLNNLISFFGGEPINWYNTKGIWKFILTLFSTWKTVGLSCVFYLAYISSLDTEMYEAADIDGASRFAKIFKITLPNLMPMIITVLLINLSFMLSGDLEQILAITGNRYQLWPETDVIASIIYRAGYADSMLSYSAAVGLFNSVLSLVIVLLANYLPKLIKKDAYTLF